MEYDYTSSPETTACRRDLRIYGGSRLKGGGTGSAEQVEGVEAEQNPEESKEEGCEEVFGDDDEGNFGAEQADNLFLPPTEKKQQIRAARRRETRAWVGEGQGGSGQWWTGAGRRVTRNQDLTPEATGGRWGVGQDRGEGRLIPTRWAPVLALDTTRTTTRGGSRPDRPSKRVQKTGPAAGPYGAPGRALG